MKPRTKKELKNLINVVKDLNSIDASLITDMAFMFNDATSFNQPLNNWNVSGVTDMREMFYNAISYSQSMSNWKLESDCNTENFLKNAIMWPRYNDENDMPSQGGKRLEVPEDIKKFWRPK